MEDFIMGLYIFFWVLIILLLVMSAYLVVVYVLQGIGLYKMAKNTGNKYAWCAWLPVGHQFLVGHLADRYNLSRQKRTHYGPLLLAFSAVSVVGTWITSAGMIYYMENSYYYSDAGSVLYSLFALAIEGIAIANLVMYCIASYNMYQDYEPSNATLYTVLAVFSLDWIAKFICRNNVPVGVAGRVYPKQPKYGQNPAPQAPPYMGQPPMYYNTPPQAPPTYTQPWGTPPNYPQNTQGAPFQPGGNPGMNMPVPPVQPPVSPPENAPGENGENK